MRIATAFLGLIIVMFSCRPAKKVQKIQEAISKVDTTAVIVVRENKTVDSTRLIKDVYNKVIKNKIDFTTFNAKVRVGYSGKEGGDEATAYIRLKKDSAIWLSLRGALGIEGFRVLITKDSVKVMNLLKKDVQYRTISYLQEVTALPFDFATLQDLVVGNPVFIDSNVISYKVNTNNELLVLMAGKFFKHLVTIDNTNYKVLHSKLDDIDEARNRTCDITFSGYENSAGIPFSTERNISVAEQSKLDISLNFKQYSFNQPLTFPFSIPKNYKRL
ncbi:MAG: hypothetical protein JWQ40_3870 [Segetibacter sp.]|nr:hypothetical protein [Segetibacter sp.]